MKKLILMMSMVLLALGLRAQVYYTNPGNLAWTWRVDNGSGTFWGNCPYTVRISMAVYNNTTNAIVPNSGVSLVGNLNSGVSAWYRYPYAVTKGHSARITAISTTLNGNFTTLPITGSALFTGYSCVGPNSCSTPHTSWEQSGSTSYLIFGDCLVGN